jgi:Family of unknown function (DUF6677)
MATATRAEKAPPLTRPLSPIGGLLSYLVPGLGQIVQGRIGKGLLFLVCIYGLFFYGQHLSAASVTLNDRTYRVTGVYLPNVPPEHADMPRFVPVSLRHLYTRPQFLTQFWMGAATWPAIAQFLHVSRPEVREQQEQADKLYVEAADLRREGEKEGDEERRKEKLAEATAKHSEAVEAEKKSLHPIFGDYQREPSAAALNAVHNAGDKRLELAWVYTVIAGVLNILVIYDAVAGPAFGAGGDDKSKPSS